MRFRPGIVAALAALAPTTAFAGTVTGEYIEARSASVWAGGCHFNGEFTTAGREAVLAWQITRGESDGVRLDGLRVAAVLSGDDNLAQNQVARRSVILVDSRANSAQRTALEQLIRQRAAAALGTVVAVRAVPISYVTAGLDVKVRVGDVARLDAKKYPCAHCRMPAQLWYEPLTATTERAVAQSVASGFADKTLGIRWAHEPSDNVFVGTFAF